MSESPHKYNGSSPRRRRRRDCSSRWRNKPKNPLDSIGTSESGGVHDDSIDSESDYGSSESSDYDS